jgi:hypothetical protein
MLKLARALRALRHDNRRRDASIIFQHHREVNALSSIMSGQDDTSSDPWNEDTKTKFERLAPMLWPRTPTRIHHPPSPFLDSHREGQSRQTKLK